MSLQSGIGLTENAITVVTVTRGRESLLRRATDSVQRQNYLGPISHLVVIDDCIKTKSFLEGNCNLSSNVIWHWVSRESGEKSGPERLAKLRNYAVQLSKTRWISFLDDDNEFEPNHLSSLLECAIQSGCGAVHSQRKLFWADGTPYLEHRWPWSRDKSEGTQIYHELVAKGVLKPGSNIERDRCDPLDHPDPVRIVDTGEWLFDRSLLLHYPFCEEYTYEDWLSITTEDDKLLQCLVKNRVPIISTEIPTLRYYLGGYSNTLSDNQPPDVWSIEVIKNCLS